MELTNTYKCKVGEASEDPDLLLYLEENVNSLTSADVASLLDYQV